MSSLAKRLLKWCLLLIMFVLVAIVSAYMGRNFTGIGNIPQRSAFAGRLPGQPDGDTRRFQFFYTTNRANTDDTFNGRGSRLGNQMLTGTFDVRISPYMPVQPWVWFEKKNMDWAGRQELSQEKFLAQLQQAVQASPQKSLLIIVWGFRDWFRSAALKTAYTAYVLDINTPVLLFDWPGNQGEGRAGYMASQVVATQSAADLGRTLAQMLNASKAEKIWLMGSSLGCQTICDAFAWMMTQPELIKDKRKIDYVVLSAPDVSATAFDEKFSESIRTFAHHLTAYVTSNDRALLMSHWLNRGRRLGRTAEVTTPPELRSSDYEFKEGYELLELQAKGFRMISIVDATPINRTRNLHHFFTDSSEFFDDLYRRLLQPDNTLSRCLHSIRTNLGVTYWILWGN